MSGEPRRRGPAWWATVVVVGAVILVVLFTVVFPWLERNLSNPTLGAVRAHSLEARSATPATLGAVVVRAASGVAGLEPVGELLEGVPPRA